MAEKQSTTISRRAFMRSASAAAAAGVATPSPAMPGVDHPDAGLLELERQWQTAEAEFSAAVDVAMRAEDHVRAVKRTVPFPAIPRRHDGWNMHGLAFTDWDGVRRVRITPEQAECGCQLIFGGDGSHQRWLRETAAECERVKAVHQQARIDAGLDAANAATTAAMKRASGLADAIAATPAETLVGAGVKARVLKANEDSVPDEKMVDSLVAVVLALTEGRA